ncbi:heavy metal translocating P-type ATPase [Nitratireductor kimnyeongensis]|uniref:Heavy metal translocating P-type ATPase n=1 Tax=Nitratireductor kimnyeongensis TaxID=430679 RepID=A0ABW0T7K6_9HYPH|nr:heavy metal translocating P-type ATPase [Nitratireductor kimnyeongensis]QZZ36428.1 heavy metal translocating P-type ATPase [Nitratireductor kimnyeongensis]
MNAPAASASPANVKRFRVEGLSCASCVRRTESAIEAVDGIESATVNLATGTAEVHLKNGVDFSSIVKAVKGAGYKIPASRLDIGVDGMTCASCVRRVEQAIAAVPGVSGVTVNLATESASVDLLNDDARSGVEEAIRKSGYTPVLRSDRVGDSDAHEAAKAAELRALKRDFTLAAIFTLPIFLFEMGSHFVPGMHAWLMGIVDRSTLYIVYFILATIVQFGPGLRFYRKGFPALMRFAPDMNSLVMLGSSAAWAYSVVATFAPAILPSGTVNVYFEASAVIVTLILLGRLLEARAKGRTGEAIKRLMGLRAKSARVLRDDAFIDVPLEEVVVGDRLQVRPGDKVPVDGVVESGASYVDEAMISGEPAPVSKAEGDEVIGGTINKAGSFVYRATKIGADTVLAQIIRMVENAQGAKLPVQAMVDRVTAWFVPAVMLAAALTFVIWLMFGPDPALAFALVNAVAVLIIACPCAMGLATPTSIMVGTGRAAQLGVLFRNGEALQNMRNTRVVAFDKTGTLTLGRPALTDFVVQPGFERADVLSLAASAEAMSEHPVADAIVEAARSEDLRLKSVDEFKAVAGFGIAADVDGRRLHIGADRFMRQHNVEIGKASADAEKLAADAKTPLYAAVDGRLAALIAIADPVKESTPEAIAALHALGLEVAMVTGDNRRTAETIAARLGIDRVEAEVLPEGKVEAIKRLRGQVGPVCFVGDGINDAPALAEADVGIAIGTGTDVAIESADVVLMAGDVTGVANAIGLSQATMKNIKQNLFWAFAYNASLIPVAAGVLYPATGLLLSPMLAAGAMALSSVFVLGNALRLKRFRAPLSVRSAD